MEHGKNLSSPMTNMFPQPGNGGQQSGDKEGWGVMNKIGAPAASVDEPRLQITEDIGAPLDGRVMSPSMGTASRPETNKR